jgi:hypothetical protein
MFNNMDAYPVSIKATIDDGRWYNRPSDYPSNTDKINIPYLPNHFLNT